MVHSRDLGRRHPMNGGIAACIDESGASTNVILHALAIADALGLPSTLLHVLETGQAQGTRPDPLEWELQRRDAHAMLQKLADKYKDANHQVSTELVEGRTADQICRWVQDHSAALIALGTNGRNDSRDHSLGNTARHVIDRASGSVLLVPPSSEDAQVVTYRRIMVPVDGSSRAESVLQLAARIAKGHKAQILLVHVVPTPELTEIGPIEADDLEMREQLIARNERVASEYLDRVKKQLTQDSIKSRALVIREREVRSCLASLIVEKKIDLVVLSAQGRSSRNDVSHGSVATHLMTHAGVPMLIVQSNCVQPASKRGATAAQAGIRLPGQIMS
jgi:nucleotide-binding universal stress UspA family protein